MLLWFVGTAVVAVWFVFRDPRFDYRLLVVGALLPDVVDLPFGQARAAHSLTVAVGTMVVVMASTAGRRPVRRFLLALPIGMMLHLVFDGVFSSASVFWWPFGGSWGDTDVPSVARGWWNVPLELAGLAMLGWAYRRFALDRPERRHDLRHHGLLVDARASDLLH
jgi:hypothetical protein